jgi:hypothetical protein
VAICGAVFAELSAHPLASAQIIEKFLPDTEVQMDFALGEVIWRDIARAYADSSRYQLDFPNLVVLP